MNKPYYYSATRMVSVTDDWYPCYPDNQIQIGLFILSIQGGPPGDKFWCRMYAWGEAHTGMFKDFPEIGYVSYEEALTKYREWELEFNAVPEGVNKSYFMSLNMEER